MDIFAIIGDVLEALAAWWTNDLKPPQYIENELLGGGDQGNFLKTLIDTVIAQIWG
ncbi:MAG: hypothetical protein LBN05_06170 [Oscillospiraceae bacterium]|jgi:hypothetical protein|nr:hypothetical protein [Oscillospiraceae bacterium]